MGHIGRDAQDFARAHDDLLAVNRELQGTFEDVGDLFIMMMVHRHMRALLEEHARQHDFVPHYHFAADEFI